MTTRRWAVQFATVAACAALLTSCGTGTTTPTAPSGTGPRTGIWQGTLADADGTTGTLRVTLEERQLDAARSLFTGSWNATYRDASRNDSGTFTGTANGSSGTLLLTPATIAPCNIGSLVPAGSYASAQLTVTNVSMQGPYSQALCTGTLNGTLILSKQ